MSAPMIIPFNFQPVNTVVGTTATYTVPAGKYAIVRLDGTAVAKISSAYASTTGVNASPTATAGNKSSEIILKSGDILSSSLSNAGGSVAGDGNGAGGSAESIATYLVNGVAIFVVKAVISCTTAYNSNGMPSVINFSGTTTLGYLASEYNIIS
jgi:hypothetical protein